MSEEHIRPSRAPKTCYTTFLNFEAKGGGHGRREPCRGAIGHHAAARLPRRYRPRSPRGSAWQGVPPPLRKIRLRSARHHAGASSRSRSLQRPLARCRRPSRPAAPRRGAAKPPRVRPCTKKRRGYPGGRVGAGRRRRDLAPRKPASRPRAPRERPAQPGRRGSALPGDERSAAVPERRLPLPPGRRRPRRLHRPCARQDAGVLRGRPRLRVRDRRREGAGQQHLRMLRPRRGGRTAEPAGPSLLDLPAHAGYTEGRREHLPRRRGSHPRKRPGREPDIHEPGHREPHPRAPALRRPPGGIHGRGQPCAQRVARKPPRGAGRLHDSDPPATRQRGADTPRQPRPARPHERHARRFRTAAGNPGGQDRAPLHQRGVLPHERHEPSRMHRVLQRGRVHGRSSR